MMFDELKFQEILEEITNDFNIESIDVDCEDVETLKEYATGNLNLEQILENNRIDNIDVYDNYEC